ncbi:hypothetical protein BVRB_8g192290 [Beta vulgaris subsp. vulgaris]|nr:hypothetical protein BVRB_8g192290 [Beta vulgaris subsp. vulgaris]
MPEDELPLRKPTKSTTQSYLSLSPLFTIFLDSLKIIFIENPKHFFTIYTFTTLPLSLLLTSSAVSSTPRFLKSHINRLEWLRNVVPIWIESANIRDELRADLRKLLRVKLAHGVPTLAFSLLSLIIIVVSTLSAYRKKRKVNLRTTLAVLKIRWGPAVVTCMVNFLLWVVWGHLDPLLGKVAVEHRWFTVVVVVVEVYAMAVFGVALVVSVVEGRAGFGAVWVGLGLMKGRRVCGWVLSGLMLLGSGLIGREMVGVMDGGDLMGGEGGYAWTVEMRFGCMVGLVVLLGWFLLWSYVVFTVFYFECRKIHVIREEEQLDVDEIDI